MSVEGWVCQDCVEARKAKPRVDIMTYHIGICNACKQRKAVGPAYKFIWPKSDDEIRERNTRLPRKRPKGSRLKRD